MKEPCPNCFVCKTYSDEEVNYLFWISFFIFKNRSIYRLLRGSVIPFVTIREYKKEFQRFLEKAISRKSTFIKSVELLENLQEQKMNMKQNLSRVEEVIESVAFLKV